jgi:hypothetical protein
MSRLPPTPEPLDCVLFDAGDTPNGTHRVESFLGLVALVSGYGCG